MIDFNWMCIDNDCFGRDILLFGIMMLGIAVFGIVAWWHDDNRKQHKQEVNKE